MKFLFWKIKRKTLFRIASVSFAIIMIIGLLLTAILPFLTTL